jgi:CHAD domain-containing protein
VFLYDPRVSVTKNTGGGRPTSGAGATADRTREIVAARGRDVIKARRRVLRKGDGEAIHDLRVATRRLQATLAIVGDRLPDRPRRRLDRRARTLRRRLGSERNTWVLIGLLEEFRSLPGREERRFVADLIRRLEHSTRARTRKEPRSLPGIRKRFRTLLRGMAPVSGSLAAPAAPAEAAMRELVGAVLSARAGTRDGDPESMHRLRIVIKRYRYALEVLTEAGAPGLRPAILSARSLQGDLGSLHDLDVLIEAVRRDSHVPGADIFLRRILRRRSRQSATTLRRLAAFHPAFEPPATREGRARRAVGRRTPAPREFRPGITAA